MKRRRIHIAVVGNGPVDPAVRFDIDAHHLVVRFNSCQNYGSSGWRTDILVIVNTGPQGQRLAYEPGAINAEALVSAKEFWFPYSQDLIETVMLDSREPLLWSNFTPDIVAQRLEGRPSKTFSTTEYWASRRLLMDLGAGTEQRASTGMQTLFHIRENYQPCRVTLYGFSHTGWDGHPWNAERALVDEWGTWIKRGKPHRPFKRFRNYAIVKASNLLRL